MTIICIKDGVVAADRGSFMGNILITDTKTKIYRSQDGALGAGTGLASNAFVFDKWFESTSHPSMRRTGEFMLGCPSIGTKDDPFCAVWLEPDGAIWQWHSEDRICYPLEENFTAQGHNVPADISRGAMMAGASAEEAVRICVKCCVYAAGEPQVERLETSPVEAIAEEPAAESAEVSGDFHASDDLPAPSDGSAWRERLNRMGFG